MRRVENRPVEATGLQAALDLLTPPFAAAAGTEVLPLVNGVVDTVRALRAPTVLARLKQPLARRAVVVNCTPDGGGAQRAVVFTAWSAAGSLLPLFTPQLPPGQDGSGPVRLAVTVRTVDGAQAHDPGTASSAATGPELAAADAADLVEAVVVEGHLARMLHLLTAEKQRIAAAAREVSASRHVSLARSGALDAIGTDHGVPRMAGEDDDAYRSRLLVFTLWRLPTPAGFELALNGVPDGSAGGGPNTGLPATVGIGSRFRIVEQDDQLAVSVRMVEVGPAPAAPGPGPWRQRFLELASGDLLLDLQTLPSARLPDATRERLTGVRKVLIDNLDRAQPITERRYLSMPTATSLARAVLILQALTGSGSMTLLSAMTRDVDERLDLGLGVTVSPLAAPRVDAAVTAARAAQQAAAADGGPGLAGAAPEVVGAVLGAVVRDRSDDPFARWLFTAAGLDASPLDDGSLYLTTLPSQGLVIEGPGRLDVGATAKYVARMRGLGTGRNVLVDEAWARAAPGLAAAGGGAGGGAAAAPAALDPAALDVLLASIASAAPAVPAALQPLVADGLMPATASDFAARVREAYDADLLLGVVVAPGGAGLAADDPAAVAGRDALVADVAALSAAGFQSVRVLPHPDGSSALLLASVSLLPGGSSGPGEPAPAMYRWYVAPFPPPSPGSSLLELLDDLSQDDDWSFRLGGPRLRRPSRWTPAPLAVRRGIGGQADLVATRPGIALVVCVAYMRRGLADPYEVRVELPDSTVLDLNQYAYLMNLLEELCPLGIEINTFDIRRNHVSPDGGPPQFLSGAVSRGYTRYRRRRPVGPERYSPPSG